MISAEESYPAYSENYLHAANIFYIQFNEIDFFVEDQDQENFYHEILKKIFPKSRIEKIFPQRGKQNLITHAKKNQQLARSIYIVDKDFDDLLQRIDGQENIFYLEKFCIENHTLEEEAFIQYIMDERPRIKRAKIASELKFKEMFSAALNDTSEIFALFYFCQKHNLSIKTTSYRPEDFSIEASKYKTQFDSAKIENYVSEINRAIKRHNAQVDFKSALNQSKDELGRGAPLDDRHISGEYLLFLIVNRAAEKFELEAVPNLNSLSYRLAKTCAFQSLDSLQKKISQYLRDRV